MSRQRHCRSVYLASSIVAHEVTNVGTDRAQLSHKAKRTKAALKADKLNVVADRDVRAVAADLGLRYVLKGGVRKAGAGYVYLHS